MYPQGEYDNNGTNVETAITRQFGAGNDKIDQATWWQKNHRIKYILLTHIYNEKIILSSVLLLSGFFIQAQQAPDKISFNSNGEFKIAQFTDMHLGHDQEKDRIVGDMIKEVLDSEKPDLVIFTGDNTTMDEVRQAWEAISAELSARRIP